MKEATSELVILGAVSDPDTNGKFACGIEVHFKGKVDAFRTPPMFDSFDEAKAFVTQQVSLLNDAISKRNPSSKVLDVAFDTLQSMNVPPKEQLH